MPRRYSKKAPAAVQTPQVESMVGLVDFSKDTYRWLFQPLYQAVLEQAEIMGDSEDLVKAKFMALLAGDTQHALLAEILGSEIKGHCAYRIVGNSIIIEQLTGTAEFIKSVLAMFEAESSLTAIYYSVDGDNADYFLDECGFEVQRVNIVKLLNQEE